MAIQNAFAGKIILITGGAAGFGLELARQLLRAGARPIVLDTDAEAIGELTNIIGYICDVTDAASLAKACAQIESNHGPIDIAIANAAIDMSGEAQLYSADDWARILDVNLKGVTNLIGAIYPKMVERQSGQFLFISSGSGRIGFPFGLPYTTSKSALNGLAAGLRAEAAPHNVDIRIAILPLLQGGLAAKPDGQPGTDRLAWLAAVPGKTYSLPAAARATLKGLTRNKPRIVFPRHQAFAYWLMDVFPPLGTLIRRQLVAKFHQVGRK
ncbi:MAG: SDR family NAD(P)-dependent oxidoreductase [Pseudomonadota bacterium]